MAGVSEPLRKATLLEDWHGVPKGTHLLILGERKFMDGDLVYQVIREDGEELPWLDWRQSWTLISPLFLREHRP